MVNKFFAKGQNILICWVAFMVWGSFLFNFSLYPKIKNIAQNMDLPEEKLGFTPEYFYGFLEKIGNLGQTDYINFQLLDYLNGFLLGLTLFATTYYLLNKLNAHKVLKLILILPILTSILDFVENTLIIYIVSNLPEKLNSLVQTTGFFTNAKLIIGSLAFLSMIICAIVVLAKFVMLKFKGK